MAQPRRTSKQSKQAGGTFLGIVLGLIVGLAIAVVVALYITRSPSPFVSKVAPPPADNGASQPQQFDPNRALQGKTPGQPVPQAAQSAPPNTAPGQAANQTQGGLLPEPQIVEVPPSGNPNGATGSNNTAASNNPSSGNGVAVAPKPADTTPPPKKTQQAQQQQQGGEDDLARFAAQKQAQQAAAQKQQQQQQAANTPKPTSSATAAAAATAKPPTANDANTGYFLQVGAYKTEGDAEQQRARLGFQGFESKVSKRDVSGVTYFRVRVGPFSKFEDMNSARQRLSDAGVDTAVIRFTKQ
ncbi:MULTISPECIES: SPOR domain-containing protein [Burkholderia]|uniref:SPOR domain-containing protein n=1 Tax=unclassified Burkholderia TaxID=2613784 RepID=UPI000B7A63FA|nr:MULTISPECIES: SPOR domain-containing protein [unclassified Burkholderia]RQU07707.1 cell division protein [Burkholderia cenocepacia]MBR8237198.1 SPOR domain-containing protein [Burkholderia sp. AU32357]MBY4876266.1 SPOR domain-containing protein [Burkholderia sp. AU42008]OXI43180.1 cell division protein [Burkholderia sp. AU17457]RQU24047.1 cell division protein [Burkholderia cenocepacia]